MSWHGRMAAMLKPTAASPSVEFQYEPDRLPTFVDYGGFPVEIAEVQHDLSDGEGTLVDISSKYCGAEELKVGDRVKLTLIGTTPASGQYLLEVVERGPSTAYLTAEVDRLASLYQQTKGALDSARGDVERMKAT